MADHFDVELATLRTQDIQAFYDRWAEGGKPMAHSLITMLRMIFGFGATILEHKQSERLSTVMHRMKFEGPRVRTEVLTEAQAKLIIDKANNELELPSLALTQAFQIDCGLQQQLVIGEWLPLAQPGESEIVVGNEKWVTGLLWEYIDKDLVMQHPNEGTFRLSEKPLVKAELEKMRERLGTLPSSGPVIVYERTGLPYRTSSFRRLWRKAADHAGVPKEIKNMDSRKDRPADAGMQSAGQVH
jgi:hypothetical protein